MDTDRELRLLRGASEALEHLLGRADEAAGPGGRALAATTVQVTAYPTVIQAYYGVQTVDVTGAETEGSAGVQTVKVGVYLALNLGIDIPPPGSRVVIFEVGGRWVFQWNG